MKRITFVALLLGAACYPATTRPDVTPMPDAARVEVELFVPQATRALALALDADSIPVRRTEPDDGWLESEWMDAVSLQPVTGRPLGIGTVKVRAFVEPGQPNHSVIIVETVYRPVVDPSRPERDLERQVPAGHPVAARVAKILDALKG
jgi:hypothetical protein